MTRKCQGGMNKFAFQCNRKPSVERDGKYYCWQHDPVRLTEISEKKRQERIASYARKEAEQDARVERLLLEKESGIDTLSGDDLKTIIALGGIRVMIAKLSKSESTTGESE